MTTIMDPAAPAIASGASVSGRILIGEWAADPLAQRLQRGDEVHILEPRQMLVLVALCQRPLEVLSAEELLDACWPAETHSDNPVHKAIAALRRAFQDSATSPRYIETIRKQGYRLIAPIRVLSGEGPRSHQGGWRGQSPFKGLEAFGVGHASVFFGRDTAVADLHGRLETQWRGRHPLAVLLGPSGSGKTSLVQAGLLPALTQTSLAPHGVPTPRLRICTWAMADLGALGALGHWPALAGALLDWELAGVPVFSGHSIDSLAGALRDDSAQVLRLLRVGLGLPALGGQEEPARPAEPPLLVLDRLEALFEPEADADTAALLDCLAGLLHSGLLLVLAICRNDFYPALARYPVLMKDKAQGAHMDLAPPGPDELAQIVRLPARAAGLLYGTDASGMNRLDDRLCSDATRAGDALPLLQYTLQALYLERAPGNELTWEAYEALGGLEGAVGRRAEAVLAALPEPQQDALLRILPRLVSLPTEDAMPSGRWIRAGELDADELALALALVEARLLVADRAGSMPGFRVAHEALLRRWPRVTSWVAQHRALLATRDELRPWVQRWLEGSRTSILLLPDDATLWQALQLMNANPQLFEADERDFIARSRARVASLRRSRWIAAAGVLALAVLAAAMAVRSAELARTASSRELQSRNMAAFMLGELADQLRPIGKLDLLDRIAAQGFKLLSPQAGSEESAVDVLQRAKALVVIGEVNSSRGKGRTELATQALDEARRMLVPLETKARLPPGDFYPTLGASAFWLGQIAYDAGDVDRAARAMSQYREASERWLKAAPGDPRASVELGFALNSLGSIAMSRGHWNEARQSIEASLALKLAALAAHPDDVDTLDAVASSRTWLGQLDHVRGETRKALALYDAAWTTQRDLLTRRPGEFVRLHDMGILEVRRAEALQALGRLPEAVKSLALSLDWLAKAIESEPGNAHWQAEALHIQAASLLARLDAGEALAGEPAAIRKRLDSPGNAARSRQYLGLATLTRLDALETGLAVRHTDWPQVLERHARAAPRLKELKQLRPNDWQAIELQARLALLQWQGLAALGRTAERRASCAQAVKDLKPSIEAGQAGRVLEVWLFARACAGVAEGTRSDERRLMDRLTSGGYQPALPDHRPNPQENR